MELVAVREPSVSTFCAWTVIGVRDPVPSGSALGTKVPVHDPVIVTVTLETPVTLKLTTPDALIVLGEPMTCACTCAALIVRATTSAARTRFISIAPEGERQARSSRADAWRERTR